MRDTVWLCKDGREVLVSRMSDDHLRNAIALVLRTGWRLEYLPRLLLEVDIRSFGLRVR